MEYFYAHSEINWKDYIRGYCHMPRRYLYVNSNNSDKLMRVLQRNMRLNKDFVPSLHDVIAVKVFIFLSYHFKHFFR